MNSILALWLAALFGVSGSGTVKQEAREVGEFHALSVSAGIQASVELGEKASLKLEADENLLPLVESRIKDGVLVLRAKESLSPSKPIKATIVATKIDAVEASGGARVQSPASAGRRFAAEASGGATVDVCALACDDVAVEGSGGAVVKLVGKAKKLSAEGSGGARLELYDVPVETAAVDVSGGARVELAVAGQLTGTASGGASIHLKGQPRRSVTTSGGARVVAEQL
jgi:hypothetical protein